MTKNEKIGITILVIITIIVIIIAVVNGKKEEPEETPEVQEEFVNTLGDGTRLNTSDKLHETKNFEGMEISNFQLTEKGNMTQLLGTVTNISDSEQGGYPVEIEVIDKQGNEIITVTGYIKKLKPGEKTQLSTSITEDYANAYDFKIKKK